MVKISDREGERAQDRQLEVLLLGTPRILSYGLPLKVERRKSRALLYYLAAHRNPVRRERLPAILWPDLEIRSAQHALSVTLHELRKTLGGLLCIEKSCLAFSPEVKADVRRYEEGLGAAPVNLEQLTELLELQRGDFLEGFELADSPMYAEWQIAERERYRRLTVHGLTCQAELYAQAGNYRAAIEALDRALELDPLQENLQGLGMRFHYLAGDRMGAIRRYHKLRGLLDEEAGVPPLPQIQALYQKIISDAPLSPRQDSPEHFPQPALSIRSQNLPYQLPFVGRRAELAEIGECVRNSGTRFILLEGEPGIGKTRLAEEYICLSGALALQGTAHELEKVLPYQPVVEAFRTLLLRPDWPELSALLQSAMAPAWRDEISRLIPEMEIAASAGRDNGNNGDKHRLWEAINRFLRVLSRRRPVLLFLDDLQWADGSTLGLLSYLIRQAGDVRVMFVGTSRSFAPDSDLAGLVQRLTRDRQVARFKLTALNSDVVKDLAGRLSPANCLVLAEHLQRSSEGNPYILTEIVRHMRESGLLSPNGDLDADKLPKAPVFPPTVESFIQTRLAQLSRTARHVIDAAAVAGREFEFELVMKVVALSEDAALEGLDELRGTGLIRALDNGMGYSFDYSLTREVVYQSIEEPRRRWFHRRAAEVLETVHQDKLESVAGLLVWHFEESKAPERAAGYALLAGSHAARLGAWTEAAPYFEKAAGELADTDRISVLLKLADMLAVDGQTGRAAAVYREGAVLAQTLGEEALAKLCLASASFCMTADLPELWWGNHPVLLSKTSPGTAGQLQEADLYYRELQSAEPDIFLRIKLSQGLTAVWQNELSKAVDYYRSALTMVPEPEHHDSMLLRHIVLIHSSLSACLQKLNNPGALEQALAGLRLTREKRLLAYQPFLLFRCGEISLAQGNHTLAEDYFREGLTLAERMAVPYATEDLMAGLGRIAAARGEKETALQQLTAALAGAEALGARHLAAQIRLWLIPLLPDEEARAHLVILRALAEKEGTPELWRQIARFKGSFAGS